MTFEAQGSSRKLAADYLCSFDYGLGGLDDAMQYSDDTVLYERPSTMLEEFVGQAATSKALNDARRVVAAATTPGTAVTQVIAGRLLRRSVELGKVAHDRAQVALKARKKRDELANTVRKMQPTVDRLANDPRMSEKHDALKQDQFNAARAAVRLDKVNAVATGLAQNAAAQAVLSQQIASSVIAGKPALTATLTSMYTKLGQSSASMQKIREQQVVKSADVLNQDKVRALLARKRALLQQKVELEVLLTCAPDTANVGNARRQMWNLHSQVQIINAEVAKLCTKQVLTALDLEGIEGLFSVFKKIGKAVGSVAKAVASPIVKVAKAVVQTAVLPATTAVKLVTKGPSAALHNVTHTMEDSFKKVRTAAGEYFVGLPCKFATSTVGKVAIQVGSAAVGTAIGGPAGTVAGAVAANRAADLSKSVCGGLDKIGLTKGNFKTSKLGVALKQTALSIGKNLIDPKKLLRDAQSAGGAFIGGNLVPTNLLNQVGGDQLKKLGLDALTKNIGLPGGASNLLKAVGVPTDVVGVLKAAGLPHDAASVLHAVGVPTNVREILKKAGVPTDLPNLLKATKILQLKGLPTTPQNLAKAMGVHIAPIAGQPGLFVRALTKGDVTQARKTAQKTIAKAKQIQKKRRAATVSKANKLVQKAAAGSSQDLVSQLLSAAQTPVAFPAGSSAALLRPYV